MPKVSIIIPVYNAEKAIQRCIDSILDQEYQDFEVIAVDDGSKDSSSKILDEYAAKDSRIHVIHKENGGVSKARNTALAAAQGEYIQFLDADDWIPNDSTKILVKAADDNQVDLTVGDFYRVVGNNVSKKGSLDSSAVMTLKEYSEKMMESPADFYYGVLWNKLYRNDLIKKNYVQMDEDLTWCEDFIFNLEYLLYCKRIYAIQVPVYYYVKTEGSLVSQSLNPLKVIEMKMNVFSYYDDYFKNILDEKDYKKDRLSIAGFLINSAGDDYAFGILPSTKKLGDERVNIHYFADNTTDIPVFAYYMTKLYESKLQSVALKYDMELKDIRVLAAVSNADSTCSLKSLSDFTGYSEISISTCLQRLIRKEFISMTMANAKVTIEMGKQADQIGEAMEAALDDFNQTVFKDFSQEEIATFKSEIEKIMGNTRKAI